MSRLPGFEDDPPVALKASHDERMETLRRNTPPGMAHWSGTGPVGKICHDCGHARFNGHYGKDAFAALKPINCAKYKELMKKRGPAFDGKKASCRFFIQGDANGTKSR